MANCVRCKKSMGFFSSYYIQDTESEYYNKEICKECYNSIKEEPKRDRERNAKINFPRGLKWIYVSLVCFFEGTEKEIKKITEDITNIINNTYAVITEKGRYKGYVNPYLGLEYVSLHEYDKGRIINKINLYSIPLSKTILDTLPKNADKGTVLVLSRRFFPITEKIGKKWKLTFIPKKTNKSDKTNLYSIENLSHDMWMLAGASNLICEKYGVVIHEEKPTYEPIMMDATPMIELRDHLLIIKYHVRDRISFVKINPDLDKVVLGGGETIFDVIKKISEHQPNSEWTKAVQNIINIP